MYFDDLAVAVLDFVTPGFSYLCIYRNGATLRIMIATDNHLGYLEDDPVRGNDSFLVCEELMQHAVFSSAHYCGMQIV